MGPGTSCMQLESMCHDSCSIMLKRAEKNICVFNGQNCHIHIYKATRKNQPTNKNTKHALNRELWYSPSETAGRGGQGNQYDTL